MTERERQTIAPGHDEIILVRKMQGTSTMVSPEKFGDDLYDWHIVANYGSGRAATLHVYSQLVLGDDGVVRVNRSDHVNGPTAVKECAMAPSGWALSV